MDLIFITGGSKQGKSTLAKKWKKDFGYEIIVSNWLYCGSNKKQSQQKDAKKAEEFRKNYYSRYPKKKVIVEGTYLVRDHERDFIEKVRGKKAAFFLLDSEAGWKRYREFYKEEESRVKGFKEYKKKFDRLKDKAIVIYEQGSNNI